MKAFLGNLQWGKGEALPINSRETNSLLWILKSADLRRVLPGLALSSLLSNILALATPLAILQIMDRIVTNRSVETLALLVVGIIVALILEEVLRSINGMITGWLGARFEHGASIAALEKLMHVPLARFQREEPVAFAEKILASARVAEFYSGQALLVLFDLPFVLIFLGLICFIGGWLVIVPAVLLAFFTLLIVHFGGWMGRQVEQRHELDERRYNFLAEALSCMSMVKALAMESLMLRRYELLQQANAQLGERLAHGGTVASGAGMLFSQIMMVGIIFFGAGLVIYGEMTPGALAACMMLSVRALQPLRRSLAVWLRYQGFYAAREKLATVMEMPGEEKTGKPSLPAVTSGLELRNVRLSHREDATLFDGLSLRIDAGQCIAIQGQSGSGKSSLLALLNGLIRPDAGEVLVDGHPIQDFSTESVRRQIVLLSQTGTLFTGTILENMTMFDRSRNHEALRIAAQLGLDQIVAGMKLGYETVLGEGVSDTLPEGVKQLINIVRMLSLQSKVILFDEANISLDMRGDRLLRDYLASLKGKCTMVLVTHRPSLLSLADQVYSLANGQIVAGAVHSAASNQAQVDANFSVLSRPAHREDVEAIIGRQFEEKSDFSVCVEPMLRALQWAGQPGELVESMPHMMQRLDITGFCSTLANLGYLSRHFHSAVAHLDARLVPCLFLPSDRPAMVLIEMRPNGSWLAFDSAAGTETEVAGSSSMEGDFYLFHKPEHAHATGHVMSWLGDVAWRFRKHIAMAFVLTLATTLLALATPLFVMLTYDRVIPSGSIAMGGLLVLGVLLAIALDWTLRLLKSRIMSHVGGRAEYILGNSLFQRIISLPTSSIEGASVSRQVGRLKNLEGLRDYFLGPLLMLVFELPANLLLLAAIALINPWIDVVVLVSALGFVMLKVLSGKLDEQSFSRVSNRGSSRWEFLNEALTNMRAIRATGAYTHWLQRYRELSGKTVVAGFRDSQLHSRVNSAAQVLGTATGLIALATSAYLTIRGQLTTGAMLASMMIVWRLTGPMQSIFSAANSYARMRNNIHQIEKLMRLPAEHEGGARQTLRPDMQGSLSFSRVSFRYANDADPALLGATFSVSPGQVVVVSGANGTGKSSLLKLILRLYVPQAGTIRFDNVDIRQLRAADLRARISYMPQSCDVFYGTVAQNLRMAYPAATDEEVRWAIGMAGLEQEIEALPEGAKTRISNSLAEQLPRGFLQRLCLARAILKPATIVLLDEPGTGMDQSGEEALLRCIEYLRGRSTVIMVSHRPSQMRLADVIIHLDNGAITAMGSFEQIKDKLMSGSR